MPSKTSIAKTGKPAEPASNGSDGATTAASPKYPPELIEEYQQLALKALETPLSPAEQARLQAAMDQINAIDMADPSAKLWREACDRIEAELAEIRRKAEALIAAKRDAR